MIATINDLDVLKLRIRYARTGAWHAKDCVVQGLIGVAIGDRITILIDGQAWVGAVKDCHEFNGESTLWIVGGAGGLSKIIPAQHYRSPTAALVIRSVLAACGETLDPSSAIPDISLPHWVTAKGQSSHALTAICDKAGLTWRVLQNGQVWIGTETWPVAEPDGVEIQDEDWTDGEILVAGESFVELQRIAPGTVYQGHQIQQVEHRIDGRGMRTVPQITSLDGAASEFLAAVRRETEKALSYPCKVVAQNADGTLQLMPEDQRLPSHGLDGVPIRYDCPGWEARVATGARVRLHYDSGDPSQLYATAWDSAADKVTSLSYRGGVKAAAGVGDTVLVFLGVGSTFGYVDSEGKTGVMTCTASTGCPGIIQSGTNEIMI